jgi:RNA-directed DNA polymerase
MKVEVVDDHANHLGLWIIAVRNNQWVLQGLRADRHTPREDRLVKLAATSIRRHVKIRGEANPYDPAWERYFTARLGGQMVIHLRGNRQTLHLWRDQQGYCPVCDQLITTVTGWHNHHIVRRTSVRIGQCPESSVGASRLSTTSP